MTFTVSVDSGRLSLVVEAEVDGVRVMVQSAYLDGEPFPGLLKYLKLRLFPWGLAIFNQLDVDLWYYLKDKWRAAVEDEVAEIYWPDGYWERDFWEREARLNEAGDRRAHEILEGGEK